MIAALHPQFWWFATRATGVTSWVAGCASLLAGLALASRAMGKRPRAPWLLDLHRGLGGITLVFLGLHLASLVADSYVHFGTADVLVPFASSWRPAAVAAGVVAMWLYVAVEASSLAMRRIPKRWWRAIHLSSYLAAVAATAHAFTAGSDATNPLFVVIALTTVFGGAFMVTYRSVASRRRRPPRVPAPV